MVYRTAVGVFSSVVFWLFVAQFLLCSPVWPGILSVLQPKLIEQPFEVVIKVLLNEPQVRCALHCSALFACD